MRSAAPDGSSDDVFQHELRTLFDTQRLEQEQSLNRFFTGVARLCERDACAAPAVANAFHRLSQSRGHAVQDLAIGGETPSEKLQIRKPASDNRGEGLLRSSGSFGSLAPATAFAVERCQFISDDGKIQKPPSALSTLLGPKMQSWLNSRSSDLDQEPKPLHPRDACLNRLIDSALFKLVSILAITFNYFFIIVHTDWKMANLNGEEPAVFKVIDLTFTAYYTFEVGVTMLALRKQFWTGPDWQWNIFDFIIVFFSLFEEFLGMLNIRAMDTSFLRVLRFFRISKILRMFEAMRAFKEVKIMIDSLVGSFMVFIFCVLMLGLYVSVFAIFFVQGLTTKLEDEKPTAPIAADTKEGIDTNFGSVLGAMVSLFMALTGGNDWIEFYATIKELGSIYSVLWFFFFLFAIVSFFNVVTGVFCEKAMDLARPGPEEQMQKKHQKEVKAATDLIRLLHDILHIRGAPNLNMSSIEKFLSHRKVQAHFEVQGMKAASVQRYFNILADVSGQDHVDFVTFVSACVKLDGAARGIDLEMLFMQLKDVQVALRNAEQKQLLGSNDLKQSSHAQKIPCYEDFRKLDNPGRYEDFRKLDRPDNQGRDVSRTCVESSPIAAVETPKLGGVYNLLPPGKAIGEKESMPALHGELAARDLSNLQGYPGDPSSAIVLPPMVDALVASMSTPRAEAIMATHDPSRMNHLGQDRVDSRASFASQSPLTAALGTGGPKTPTSPIAVQALPMPSQTMTPIITTPRRGPPADSSAAQGLAASHLVSAIPPQPIGFHTIEQQSPAANYTYHEV